MEHFVSNHSILPVARFQVTLPRKPDTPPLGESCLQAVKWFQANEASISRCGTRQTFQDGVQEYLDLGHAEPVPVQDLKLPHSQTYYMPMHAVIKDSSTTTKLRVVFDASARITSGISFNETLMVGPTLYPNLTDIFIRFRTYPMAISGDVSKMYRAIELSPTDRDYHRFIWRADKSSPLQDYRMKRVTFGITASPI